jgi:hypothetical protein
MTSESPAAIAGRSLPDRPATDGTSPPDRTPTAARSPTNVAALTNDPAKSRWDLKTPRGRRCRDLYRSCLRLIGNPSDATRQAQAIAAAEQLVLAEIAREASLADPTDKKIDLAIKTEKAARHALESLGIKKPLEATDQADDGYGLFVDDDEDTQ